MITRNYRLKTVLFIVLANIVISSPIFAQVKTTTKKAQIDLNKKKEISKTKVEGKSATKEFTNKQLLKTTEEGEAATPQEVETPTPPYSVGDFIHGGIVIYVDKTGEHGLVCTKTDQSTNSPWSNGVFGGIGADEEGLYKGMENTIAAVASETSPNTAPIVCYNLEITEGGITYTDWYLPSKYELSLISQNYAVINAAATANGGDDLYASWYWSSTEDMEAAGSYAWCQYIGVFNSDKLSNHKKKQSCVRAVRRF